VRRAIEGRSSEFLHNRYSVPYSWMATQPKHLLANKSHATDHSPPPFPVTLSPCHLVTQSPCHVATPSPRLTHVPSPC
jgi:hypothetical protein